MTAIADFYHAPDDTEPPRWLGSLHGGDVHPNALAGIYCGLAMLNATDLREFLFTVSDLLKRWTNDTTTAHHPVDGWPWPWQDDRHADWIYTFDGRRVWSTHRRTTHKSTTVALTLDPDDILLNRAAAILSLARANDNAEPNPGDSSGTSTQRAHFDLVTNQVQRAATRTERLSDFEVADLVLALNDSLVHDCCLSFATGEHAEAAEKLWMELVTTTPRPARANPTTLLAMTAFIRGDHRLTEAALAHLDHVAPDHPVARLLRPGHPRVSREDLRRTAEESHHLIRHL